ncbi:MAG: hypothetical protein JSS66_05685 [Armatimonadetes bacterium]|nr:hypothetical protein [Armatimonadota bacterium]
MPQIPYKVIRRSTNTNSFGLYGMWLLGIFGDVWEVGASSLNAKQVDDIIKVKVQDDGTPNWAALGFEIPEAKPDMPAEIFNEVWSDAEPGLAYQDEMLAAGMSWEYPGFWVKALSDRQYFVYYDDHGDWYPHSMGEPCSIRCETLEGEEKYQRPFATVREALDYIAGQTAPETTTA